MATILDVFTRADRLNVKVTRAYRPQLIALSETVLKANQRSFAALALPSFATAFKATHQPQFTALAKAAFKIHQPSFAALAETTFARISDLVAEGVAVESHIVRSGSGIEGRQSQRLGDREIAAMLAVAVFLLVYISTGWAIEHNFQLAKLSTTNGPIPFDAALLVGGFTYKACMTYFRRSS